MLNCPKTANAMYKVQYIRFLDIHIIIQSKHEFFTSAIHWRRDLQLKARRVTGNHATGCAREILFPKSPCVYTAPCCGRRSGSYRRSRRRSAYWRGSHFLLVAQWHSWLQRLLGLSGVMPSLVIIILLSSDMGQVDSTPMPNIPFGTLFLIKKHVWTCN